MRLTIDSGFDVEDGNQACVSTYTIPTTVNYWGIPNTDDTYGTQIISTKATIGPGVLWQRPIILLQASETSKSTTARSTTGSSASIASQTATQSSASATAVAVYHSSGPSNAVIIALSAILGLIILILLFLVQKFLRHKSAQKKKGTKAAYPVHSTVGGLFLLPFVVAILTGVTTCILAARRSWQEDIIRRWDSPDSVLRVVQVLSFIIRLCATVFGWSCVTDVGWLIMKYGEQSSSMIRILDMTVTGGTYL